MRCGQGHCSHWRTSDYYSTRPYDHNRACAQNQTYGTNSVPPGEQGRTDQDSTSSRRRIPVACARCRKRKIKCSGPTGSVGSCVNCKNSGIDPKQCQFHRVSSKSLDDSWDVQAEEAVFNALPTGPSTTSSQSHKGSYYTIDSQQHGSSTLGYGTWQSTNSGMENMSETASQQDSRTAEMPFGYNIAGIDHHLSRQAPYYPEAGYSDHACIPSSQSSLYQHPTGRATTWSNHPMSSANATTAHSASSMTSSHGGFESRQLPVPTDRRSSIGAPNGNGLTHSQPSVSPDAPAMTNNTLAHGDFNGMHAESCPAAQAGVSSLAPLSLSNGTGWMPPTQFGAGFGSYNNSTMGPPVSRFDPNSIDTTANQRRASHDHPLRSNSSLESSRSYSLPTNHSLSRSASDFNLYSFGNESLYNIPHETLAPQISHMRSQGQSNNPPSRHSVGRRQSNPSPKSGSSAHANRGSYLQHHQ